MVYDSQIRWNKKNSEKIKEYAKNYYQKHQQQNKDKNKMKQREFRQYMKDGAACAIIKKHHEDMKDDPDRLTTDFMKRIVGIKC